MPLIILIGSALSQYDMQQASSVHRIVSNDDELRAEVIIKVGRCELPIPLGRASQKMRQDTSPHQLVANDGKLRDDHDVGQSPTVHTYATRH